MRFWWLRLCLLGTFAFWATGTARYAHEAIEHHGRDASVQPDDDGDDDSLAAAESAAIHAHQKHAAPPRPCVLCQMLTAMTADRAAPPQLPQPTAEFIASLPLLDWAAPHLQLQLHTSARAPPAC